MLDPDNKGMFNVCVHSGQYMWCISSWILCLFLLSWHLVWPAGVLWQMNMCPNTGKIGIYFSCFLMLLHFFLSFSSFFPHPLLGRATWHCVLYWDQFSHLFKALSLRRQSWLSALAVAVLSWKEHCSWPLGCLFLCSVHADYGNGPLEIPNDFHQQFRMLSFNVSKIKKSFT